MVSRARGRTRSAGRAVPTSQQDSSAFIRSHSGPPTRTPGLDGEEIAMNLEQLRKQAKDLVRTARAGDPDAIVRLGGCEPILARAQLVVAREQGYASWPALVAAGGGGGGTVVMAATAPGPARGPAPLAAG